MANSSRASRWRRGRTSSPCTPSSTSPRVLLKVRRRELRVLRQGAAAGRRSSATAGSAPSTATERRARRSRRQALRRKVLPAVGEGEGRGDGQDDCSPPSRARIDKLDWMAPATKEKAKAKLAALKVGVGYPDKWRDYSELDVVRGDAFGNAERAELFELQRNLAQARAAGRSRRVGDAAAAGQRGEPAGDERAQLPGGDPAAAVLRSDRGPTVMDYGAAGSVIGHEISHSFDDQGALFDATGRLRTGGRRTTSRTSRPRRSARRRVRRLSAVPRHARQRQADARRENIADVAGLAAAYDAYRVSLGGKAAPPRGFTGDQQFFISFGQSWRTKIREAALRAAPAHRRARAGEYRADTVRNLDPWYAAFGPKAGESSISRPAIASASGDARGRALLPPVCGVEPCGARPPFAADRGKSGRGDIGNDLHVP